jgi:hypothetical protein
VQLEEVERGRGEVGLGGGGGEAAHGEPVEELFDVADGGFDGTRAPRRV